MNSLVSRRAGNDEEVILSPAQTYAKVRRVFSSLVQAVYRIDVVGADRLPVTGPAVVAPNHESVLDPFVLGAAI